MGTATLMPRTRKTHQTLYVNSCFYSPAAFCTKVTLLLLIARVFSVHAVVGKCIRAFIVALLLAYIPIVALKIFTCHPVNAYWEMPEMAGVSGNNPNCLDQSKFFMGDISIAIITDFLILILPIPLAWTMEAPRAQKIKIAILLGAGGAATGTSTLSRGSRVGDSQPPRKPSVLITAHTASLLSEADADTHF